MDLPTGELIVVTGPSGSGKSSLVFDTLYAEGQRRYVETFSPYARQFLDRMDKPQVDAIEGIPPAIAIDQTNPVRTSRSTVGTMTEINDHLKLLFARCGKLFCRQCARPVRRDTPDSIYAEMAQRAEGAGDPRLVITFPVDVPKNFTEEEVMKLLQAQGYTRIHERKGQHDGLISFEAFEKIQARLKSTAKAPARKDINGDFPLRGFILCNDCGKPLTACWSQGKYQKYPYYLCATKGCASYRKSIKRDELETAFEGLLRRLEPSPNLFGVVIVPKSQETREVTEDDVLEATLEAGAEEVNDLGDSIEVVSEATDLVEVRTALQAQGLDYDSAEASFLPSMQVELDESAAGKVFRLVEALEDLDDVQNVYANFDVSDEVMAALDA